MNKAKSVQDGGQQVAEKEAIQEVRPG